MMWNFTLVILSLLTVSSCSYSCINSSTSWGYLESDVNLATDQLEEYSAQGSIPADTLFDPNNIQSPTWYNDTLFLRRTVKKYDNEFTSYNFVYVDTNRNSKYYDWLTSFAFSEYDIRSLESYNIENITSSKDLEAHAISGLPLNWLPLCSFQGDYVVYKPSDFGNAGRRILTKDYFIFWYMDGPMPFEIRNSRVEVNSISIELNDPGENPSILSIHCIDEKRQIYVFENPSNPERSRFQLYIPAERAKDFDIVVNTGNEKAWEYEFDLVDFKTLLDDQ